MPHIHTNQGDHDLTTTGFIIRLDDSDPKALLHMHRKLSMLLPVGGHVELNENPWKGILHEIEEEAGYTQEQLKVLQPRERILKLDDVKNHPVPLFLQTHQYGDEDHYHVDVGFGFVTNESPAKLPNDGESSDLRWLRAVEVQEQRSNMPPDIAQIYDFIFSTALASWERISCESFDA